MTLSRALFVLSALNVATVVGAALNNPDLFGLMTCPVVLAAAMVCALAGLPVLSPAPR